MNKAPYNDASVIAGPDQADAAVVVRLAAGYATAAAVQHLRILPIGTSE
jgi:hypothetical protein